MRARLAPGAGVFVIGMLGAPIAHSLLTLFAPQDAARGLHCQESALGALALLISGVSLTGAGAVALGRWLPGPAPPARSEDTPGAGTRRAARPRLAEIPSRRAPPEAREFEMWCAARLHEAKWSVQVVGGPGDLGVDIRAARGGELLAVQCKAVRRRAGIASVQQVFAGGTAFGADRAAVVCPAGFTGGARCLAARIGVRLVLPHELDTL